MMKFMGSVYSQKGAAKGTSEIAGDATLNKMGKYSFKNTKKNSKIISFYFCSLTGNRRCVLAHSNSVLQRVQHASNW